METISKKKLTSQIARTHKMHPTQVQLILQAFLDQVMDYLIKGDRLEFRDFGVFEVVKRKAKIGRNPKKASIAISIPERRAVKFTPGGKMKTLVEKNSSISPLPSSRSS